MKGYECKKCGTELLYEQIQGIRVKRIGKNGKEYFSAYCPTCVEYFKTDKYDKKELIMYLTRVRAIKIINEKLSTEAPYKFDEKTIIQLFGAFGISIEELIIAKELK